MIDVGRIAGVSSMTVSRAFRNDGSVTAKTRAEIMKAAEMLGYVFDSTASNLRSQRTKFIAATIPSINNANFADTVRGLSERLEERGLEILLGYTDYDIEKEEDLIEQLLRRRPEAIVLTGGSHTPRARRLLENAGIPIVEIWDRPRKPLGHVVGFSNAAAMGTLVDHFVAQGKTRIAFFGGETDRDTRGAERRIGFIRAMRRHGLDPSRLIATGKVPISMREGAEAMAHLLHTMPDTEVAIGTSDLSAFGALTECQRRGIAVPDQLSIAGFGNFEVAAVCVPALTTVDPFSHEIGVQAADIIIEALDGRLSNARLVPIRPQLLVRGSSV
jgi:LacI family gluconate utilization system Gnt-I transcriptional repressor